MSQKSEFTKQLVRYIIYLLVVIGLTVLSFYLTLGKNIDLVILTLRKSNLFYILAVLGVVLILILLRSTVIFCLTRTYNKKYTFHRAMAIDQVGALYRMVTPAGLGGHVMEAYTYKKQKVSLSHALSILAMYSLIYQVVLILYNIITLIVKHKLITDIGYITLSFNDSSSFHVSLWLLIVIGFLINLLVIGFIFLISYWNGFYRFMRNPIGRLFKKVKIVKDEEKYHNKIDGAVVSFRKNLSKLLRHYPTLIICAVCFFLYISLTYSVPYIVGKSLNNTSVYANVWDSIFLGNLHQMITCIIPLPGSSLVSELFFLRLFYPAVGPKFYSTEEIARASLLLWRSLLFIIPLFIACLVTVLYRPRKEKKDADHSEDQIVQE